MARTEPFDKYLNQYEKWFEDIGFTDSEVVQTVFGELSEIHAPQKPREGYGEGGFVVIRASKE